MIWSSVLNSITFKNIIGATLGTPVNATFTNGLGSLADGTYYYRVSALTSNGETLPSTETSLAIAKLTTPVNAAFTAGSGTLAIGTYYYRVAAINVIGQTLASTETSLFLAAGGGVNVNWGAVSGATGYKIYGRTIGAELLITTVGAVTTFLDDGSLTPAGAMPVSNTTAGGINVNWTALEGATGYKVYGRSIGAELLIATVIGAVTYLDSGSITPSGAMPTSNTTGTNSNYPNMWNTLHADRSQGNALVKHYNQKFQKDHVVYLQFESDIADSITLKAYNSLTRAEIESFTGAYATHYGTTNNRYYTNFVVTLDSPYYEKQVYFKATQGANVLTSEPIFTTDLTYWIQKGVMKYIKVTNLDRIESDLDNRFIDWSALTSTGNYIDWFIEASEVDKNDKDEAEILEGSQSRKTTSAVNFIGIILGTSGVPHYMIDRMKVAVNLDIFTVNGEEYGPDGGADSSPFGGSTSFQMRMKLTQKNAIGINVDNVGITEGSVTPPISGTPMYVGSVTSAAPNETEVKLIASITAAKTNQTKVYTITDARFCFAYPTTFGALSSILDNIGDEIISGFAIQTLTFTIDGNSILFNIYTLKNLTTVTSYSVQYKW